VRITLLLFVMLEGARAASFMASTSVGNGNPPCSSSGANSASCGSSANDPRNQRGVSAQSGIDPLDSMPFAIVSFSAGCLSTISPNCFGAYGTASFSVDYIIRSDPSMDGTLGIVVFNVTGNGGGPFGSTQSSTAGLIPRGMGLNGYFFTYGQTFTLNGTASGGCSDCSQEASRLTFSDSGMVIYDLNLDRLPASKRNAAGEINILPEPATWSLLALGLLGLALLQKKRNRPAKLNYEKLTTCACNRASGDGQQLHVVHRHFRRHQLHQSSTLRIDNSSESRNRNCWRE
jgi:PEP-CTERM motif